MSAHDELRTLVQRYARAADERDIDALRSLFHADATIQGTRGAQTVEEWLDAMRQPSPFSAGMHLLADPLIELDGDDAALLDTYAVVFQIGDRDAGQSDLTLGIRYLDEAARDGDRWVIRRRTARTLWMR